MLTRTRSPLYVWEALGPDGEWYTIGVVLPAELDSVSSVMPLVMRSRDAADAVMELALGHGNANKEPVRLAKYEFAGTA